MRRSTDICKSFVRIDASELYPYSMRQPMPTGLYTRWDIDSETSRFTPRQNQTRRFEKMVMSYFWRKKNDCKNGSVYTTADRRKLTPSMLIGFVLIAKLCLREWVALTTFVPFKSSIRLSLKKISNVAVRKKNSMNWDEARVEDTSRLWARVGSL